MGSMVGWIWACGSLDMEEPGFWREGGRERERERERTLVGLSNLGLKWFFSQFWEHCCIIAVYCWTLYVILVLDSLQIFWKFSFSWQTYFLHFWDILYFIEHFFFLSSLPLFFLLSFWCSHWLKVGSGLVIHIFLSLFLLLYFLVDFL